MKVLKYWLLLPAIILSVLWFVSVVCAIYSNVVYVKYINSTK